MEADPSERGGQETAIASSADRRASARYERFAVVVGVVVAVVGFGFVLAWLAGMMPPPDQGGITVKTNAGLCLGLSGLALCLLVPHDRSARRNAAAYACAGLLLLIGFATLLQNLLNINLGIDQLLATEAPGSRGVLSPNRMGVPASVSFTLLGGALLIFTRGLPRAATTVQLVALAVITVTLCPLLGYLGGVEELYATPASTAIAWPMATSLLLYCVGLLCVRPDRALTAQLRADDPGGIVLRRMLLPIIALPAFLIGLQWIGRRNNLFSNEMGDALAALVAILAIAAVAFSSARRVSRHSHAERLAAQRLAEQARDLNELVRLLDLASVTVRDIGGRVTRWNAASERLYGFTARQALGRDLSELLQTQFPMDPGAIRQSLMANGRWEGELIQTRADGRRLTVASEWVLFRDDAGQPRAIVEASTDITARKEFEEALRESEERYREFFELSAIGAAHADPATGRFLRVNDRYCQLTGYSREELLNLSFKDITHPDDRAADFEVFQAAMRGESGECAADKRYIRKTGEAIWVHVAARPVRDEQDKPLRSVAIIIDITDRKQAEANLQRLNLTLEERIAERTAVAERRATQLQALAGELSKTEQRERNRLARLLHDGLQQLLVAAKIQVGFAQEDDLSPTAARSLGLAVESLDESLRLSRSLTTELSPPVLHSGGLIPGLNWLARWMEEKHRLHVDVDCREGDEPSDYGLRAFLFDAVRELLLNVSKYSGVDRASVSARRTDAGRLNITVEDRGKGFDPSRLVPTGKTAGGLGLFSIRERVDLLGGRLTLVTAPGKGTRVTIESPLAPAELEASPAEATTSSLRRPEAAPAPTMRSQSKIRLIIADDHKIVREGLVGLVARQGNIEVVGEAEDGEAAVDMVQKLRPDVVLMDLNMPRMSGLEATTRISRDVPETKVICLSMHNDAEMAARMRAAGAFAYLTKDGPARAVLAAIALACPAGPA